MNAQDVAVFVESHRAGSLSEAARRLGITPAVASKRLAVLESSLGVRLLQRSTRRLQITPEGEAFLQPAQALLDAHEEALDAIAPGAVAPRGLIRLTAPFTFGTKVLWRLLPDFLSSHPALQIDVQLSDKLVDLYEESIDLAIRIAHLQDSNLVAKAVAPNEYVLVASPGYVERHGLPRTVGELPAHECLTFGGATQWSFGLGREQRTVRVGGRVRGSAYESAKSACLAGLGITYSSRWDVEAEIDTGVLVPVSLDLPPTPSKVWLVTQSRVHRPMRLKVISEYLSFNIERLIGG